MPQEVLRQSNFNGGELSPWAVGRRDLKAYASSLALCVNMTPRAEGPAKRRPGLKHIDLVRNRLERVEVTAAMMTAPNGGDVGVLASGSGFVTTAEMGAINLYVVVEVDFGAPVEVGLVDLIDFAVVDTAGGGGGGVPAPPQFPWNPPRNEMVVLP